QLQPHTAAPGSGAAALLGIPQLRAGRCRAGPADRCTAAPCRGATRRVRATGDRVRRQHMKMTQTWLAGLFAAQLALAGGLFVADLQRSAGSAPRPLLGFAMEDVERVLIEDGSSTATLQREDAGWQLPRLAGLPVNGQRLNSLDRKSTRLNSS